SKFHFWRVWSFVFCSSFLQSCFVTPWIWFWNKLFKIFFSTLNVQFILLLFAFAFFFKLLFFLWSQFCSTSPNNLASLTLLFSLKRIRKKHKEYLSHFL